MLVGEHAFVMLLSREKFAEFAKLPIADPTTHTLALYCFSVSSRDEVDTVSAAALAAGGSEVDDAEDYGFMYSRSFFDLDGHGWQVMWMDPAAAEQGPQAFAASMQDADAAARRELLRRNPRAGVVVAGLVCDHDRRVAPWPRSDAPWPIGSTHARLTQRPRPSKALDAVDVSGDGQHVRGVSDELNRRGPVQHEF